jgi:hypothetical protein
VAACIEASLDTVGLLSDLLGMTANTPERSALWNQAPQHFDSEERAVAMCAIMHLLQLNLECVPTPVQCRNRSELRDALGCIQARESSSTRDSVSTLHARCTALFFAANSAFQPALQECALTHACAWDTGAYLPQSLRV